MKFTDDTEDNTPKTRDLKNFINPNPKVSSKMVLFKERSTLDLKEIEGEFQKWEDDNEVCALVIDTSTCPPLKDDFYLMKAREVLSCPIIRMQDMKEQDDIFDARVLGFDAQISSPKNFDAQAFYKQCKLAEAQNLVLIPAVAANEDWVKLAPLTPQFVYIHEAVGDDLPPVVKESGMWVLGPDTMKDKHSLKCVVEEYIR